MVPTFIFDILILLFSVSLHEMSHGAMAERLGDPTARLAGRITLNPLRHLDLFGSFLVPLALVLANLQPIGWAKPVPINPFNFRDKKYGQAKSAMAGPAANLAVALFFGIAIRFLPSNTLFWQNMLSIFGLIVIINLLLAIFNLIPIPPLDGSHILFTFLPRSFDKMKIFLAQYGFFFLLFFLFFLFPVIFPIVGFLFTFITGRKLT